MITMIIIKDVGLKKRNLTEMNNVNNDFKVYENLYMWEEIVAKTKNMESHHMMSKKMVDNIKIKVIRTMVGISNNLHHMHSHIIMVIEDK